MASLDSERGTGRRPRDEREPGDVTGGPAELFGRVARDATQSPVAGWDQDLTRRMRVLLHIAPLLQLKASDNRRDDDLRHYDSLTLAMKVLDVVAERMGMETEADRDSLVFALRPILESMDRTHGVLHNHERHERMVDKVLGGLRNDTDGRRPFKIQYADVNPNGEVVERQLEFRLVCDAFGKSGSTVLRLSNEAVNLFFNALELDIEDAQAATEAIVQSQLVRGRFDEAVRSAQYALRQSRLYKERLSRILRDTRRDIARVDWKEAVPKLIDDATTHLEARLDTERNIVETTNIRMDNLPPGGAEAKAVARIGNLMQRCIDTHTLLQRQLMTARTTFLDSQARQAFLPTALRSKPDLTADVLTPLLNLPQVGALDALNGGLSYLMGPSPDPLPSLYTLVDGLLAPRRRQRRDYVAVDPVDVGQLDDELAQYSPETRAAAIAALEAIDTEVRLSSVLESARAADLSTDVLEVMVLILLQNYDQESVAEEGLMPHFRVERKGFDPLDEELHFALDDPDFFGDDLIITPIDGPQLGTDSDYSGSDHAESGPTTRRAS